MAAFHTPEYLDFLRRITPDNYKNFTRETEKCACDAPATARARRCAHPPRAIAVSVGESTDCPVFDGLYDFCRLYTGASLGAPRLLRRRCPAAP